MSPRRISFYKQTWNKIKSAAGAVSTLAVFTGGGYWAGNYSADIKSQREITEITTTHQRQLIDEFDKGKTAGQEEFRKRQEDFMRFIDLQEKTKKYGK